MKASTPGTELMSNRANSNIILKSTCRVIGLLLLFGFGCPVFAATLFEAASEGNLELVKQIVIENPDLVNRPGENNSTALQFASYAGHLEVVQFLMENGADIDHKDNDGDPALVWAVLGFRLDVAKYLLEQGASFEGLRRRNKPLIAYFTENGRADLVKTLLDRKAVIDYTEEFYDRSLIHIAAINGNLAVARMLIDAGIEINSRDVYGHTPLYYARKLGYVNIGKALKEEGAVSDAEVSAKDPREYLSMELNEEEAILWYLDNAGYAIKTKNNLIIFDYWEKALEPDIRSLFNGHINPEEIKDLNVTVFVTHEHRDHYDTVIFEWEKQIPNIQYVFGWNGRIGNNYISVTEHRQFDTVGTIEYYASFHQYNQTPESSFLIRVDGLTIFNTGDLMLYEAVEDAFYENIGNIAALNDEIDIAFVCTNTTAASTSWKDGIAHIARELKPRVLIPTHSENLEYLFAPLEEFLIDRNVPSVFIYPDSRGDGFIYRHETMARIR
ncbi:MAG: ankyrin repeat domain-containing protein [Candidatus Zixiibacteriota bacterium]|nr:MAG: ankyrin repeat domain-containing protein [candidate division Zixibacteria bacterium]